MGQLQAGTHIIQQLLKAWILLTTKRGSCQSSSAALPQILADSAAEGSNVVSMSRDVPVQLPPELHSAPRGVLEVGACILPCSRPQPRPQLPPHLQLCYCRHTRSCRKGAAFQKGTASSRVLLHQPWMLQAFKSGLLGP